MTTPAAPTRKNAEAPVQRYTSLAEYGRYLASLEPPITDEQAEAAARILTSSEEVAA